MRFKRLISSGILIFLEILLIVPCYVISYLSRFYPRKVDVGLGPEPLINNVYHKKALTRHGYSAETFVSNVYFITNEFDFSLHKWRTQSLKRILIPFVLFMRCLFRYKALFIYFHGGPLSHGRVLSCLEPHFYKAANIKVVVMPYGSDVQVMTRSNNLYFKHALSMDYPGFYEQRSQVVTNVDRWTRHADWVISGCEWVDYMYHWNTLLVGHFSIDLEKWTPAKPRPTSSIRQKLRILHAPNHPGIKGTKALLDAVEVLKGEGL
ncbi:MAG: hypothetical protein GTO24_05420, partial [candidate division Zixibacteria bacterium]|nr:hypothetical protein [candidate division Zixibacteria bacterium]